MEQSAVRVEPGVDDLFAAHYVALVRLAVHLVDDLDTAEDLVQDVFAALPASGGIEHPKRYLTTAVVNRARSVLRRRRVVRAFVPSRRDDFAAPADEGALRSVERSRLLAAIRRLPTRQREVVVLRYYEDLSVAEIATVLDTSAGAISSALNRALAALATTPEVRDAD
jgi:RNA polymerase sigma factor (sigma-70 family)